MLLTYFHYLCMYFRRALPIALYTWEACCVSYAYIKGMCMFMNTCECVHECACVLVCTCVCERACIGEIIIEVYINKHSNSYVLPKTLDKIDWQSANIMVWKMVNSISCHCHVTTGKSV